jgi:hypothetical protein
MLFNMQNAAPEIKPGRGRPSPARVKARVKHIRNPEDPQAKVPPTQILAGKIHPRNLTQQCRKVLHGKMFRTKAQQKVLN